MLTMRESNRVFVDLVRRIVDLAFRLTLDEDCGVLDQLWSLGWQQHVRRITARREGAW